jgi:ubiquitin C-terminal hydrolase
MNYNDQIKPLSISNTGNFCYIISSVQALFNTSSIFNFLFNDNDKIDDYYNKVLNVLDLTSQIYNKKQIKEILDIKLKFLNDNPEIFNDLLTKLEMNKKIFNIIVNKIENNISQIYIYIYLKKFACHYFNNNEHNNSEEMDIINSSNRRKKKKVTNNLFMEYIKINNIILNNMGIDELVDGNQHDAQEYILTLIDILNDSHTFDLLDDIDDNIKNISDEKMNKLPLNKRILYGYKKTFYNYNKNGYSSIKKNLYFYTLQSIDCRNCKFRSLSYQENSMLTLPIPEHKSNNLIYNNFKNNNEYVKLYNCLDLYFEMEIMDHEYKCDNCNEKVTNNILSKKILTSSNTLIIFLKRFNFDIQTLNMTKNTLRIEYPFILNLGKYSINDKELTYNLKSVICHHGLMDHGHYYSYINKNNDDNIWYKCNDEYITNLPQKNINDVIDDNAYILFYEKC